MHIVLSVSSILLLTLLSFRHIECKVRIGRFFELSRRRLDRLTVKGLKVVYTWLQNIFEFVHKDIFLYSIHFVVYVVLFVVRVVERWLDKMVQFIRSFRKKRRSDTGEASEGLRNIVRNEQPDEQLE